MIQSILFFVLGFLAAGLIALLVGPAFTRRAARLERERLYASLPVSLDEFRAEKDRFRGEAAMAIRRLEMTAKSSGEKYSVLQVEHERRREELRQLAAELAERNRTIADLQQRLDANDLVLRERQEQIDRLSAELDGAHSLLEERAQSLAELERLRDDASFASSSHRIELAAREAEIEKLSTDAARMRGLRKEADRRAQQLLGDNRALQDALKAERERVATLERKLEQVVSQLASREEALERRERDLAKSNAQRPDVDGAATQLAAAAKGNIGAKAGQPLPEASAARLQARVTTLVRENKKLKARLASGDSGSGGDVQLREQMLALAADVVHLTAMLEGPDSEVLKLLKKADPAEEASAGRPSLADRIRALQAERGQSSAREEPSA